MSRPDRRAVETRIARLERERRRRHGEAAASRSRDAWEALPENERLLRIGRAVYSRTGDELHRELMACLLAAFDEAHDWEIDPSKVFTVNGVPYDPGYSPEREREVMQNTVLRRLRRLVFERYEDLQAGAPPVRDPDEAERQALAVVEPLLAFYLIDFEGVIR